MSSKCAGKRIQGIEGADTIGERSKSSSDNQLRMSSYYCYIAVVGNRDIRASDT